MNYNEFLYTRKKYLKEKEKFDREATYITKNIQGKMQKWLAEEFPFGRGSSDNKWYLQLSIRLTYDLILVVKLNAYNTGYTLHRKDIETKLNEIVEENYLFIEKIEIYY